MRAYTLRAAAYALRIDSKTLDNVITRVPFDGVVRAARGVERRLPLPVIHDLAVLLELNRVLGLPLATAADVARRVREADGAHQLTPDLTLTVALGRVRARVDAALAEAVERVPRPPRGRPPRRRRPES